VSEGRRRDFVAIALLLSILAIVFADIVFSGAGFYGRDVIRYYEPTRHLVREIVRSGVFPAWNPYFNNGQPLAANPDYGALYPGQWLTLVGDFHSTFQLHILLHLFIGAWGAYVFARGSGSGRSAAVFGGLTFLLSGFILSQINLLPILFCAAWLPWMLVGIRSALTNPSASTISRAALLIGVQALVGEPASLLQSWIIAGAFGLAIALR
jgi:hypothetical protein